MNPYEISQFIPVLGLFPTSDLLATSFSKAAVIRIAGGRRGFR